MPKPTTPITIPHTLPTPLPPSLRDDIANLLLRERAIPTILQTLETECQKAGWQDAVKERILELLQSGKVGSARELTDVIIQEATGVSEEERHVETGENEMKRKGKDEVGRVGNDNGGIRVPQKAVEEGTKIVREVVGRSVVVEPEERDFWG